MIACWYKTYIRRFGEETEKKKVTCNHRPDTHYTKFVIIRVAFHGGSSHFFGIGIYPVSDTAGIGIFWSVLLYCKLWREHLFKISRELFF